MKIASAWLVLSVLATACQGSSSDGGATTAGSSSASAATSAPSANATALANGASGTSGTSAVPSASAPFVAPDSLIAQHILVAYKGAKNAPKEVTRTRDEARTRAGNVRDEARAGTPFEDLVARYSEDPGSKDRLGSVGKITPGKMVKPFSDAAFALRVNEVSDVVESPFGFHVIKRTQ